MVALDAMCRCRHEYGEHVPGECSFPGPRCPCPGFRIKGHIDPSLLLRRLEQLRANLTENAVLDLMDEVVGFCPPHRSLSGDQRWVGRIMSDPFYWEEQGKDEGTRWAEGINR